MVRVHVRVRPLSKEEEKEGHQEYDFDIMSSEAPNQPSSVTLLLKQKRYQGFATVEPPSSNNRSTYVNAVQPLIPSVLLGHTVCCFCYGHTNSGKTHTIMGYDLELGMYKHAVQELFHAIKMYEKDSSVSSGDDNDLLIQVRFAEVYNGRVYDLLDDRKECHVREDADSTIHIRSATQMKPDGQVLVQSLFAEYGKDSEEIIKIVTRAMDIRAKGTSELHDQSSRSHAVLELEIVTPKLARCRQQVVIAESEVVPVGKRRDTAYITLQSKIYVKTPDGGYSCDNSRATQEDHDELAKCNAELAVQEEILAKAKEETEKALKQGSAMVGGKFVFVDLAGAEFTGEGNYRSPTERKEAREINTSLLALKECIRSQHIQSAHIPYRNSKLTMILKPYLVSEDQSTVMIANVSSSLTHLGKTINTVQYASLVSGATAST